MSSLKEERKRINNIYIEEIEKEKINQNNANIIQICRNKLKQLKIIKSKDAVKRQINRLKDRFSKYGSYEERNYGGTKTQCKEENILKGIHFYRKYKNKNVHKNIFEQNLADSVGIKHQSSTWYDYLKLLQPRLEDLDLSREFTAKKNINNKKSCNEKSRKCKKTQHKRTRCKKASKRSKKKDKPGKADTNCQVCGGVHDHSLHPTFRCSICSKRAHPDCDPVIKYSTQKDVFEGIDLKNLEQVRKSCVKKLQRDYVCCGCLHGKRTKLKNSYDDFEGNTIESVEVEFSKGNYVKVTEYDEDGDCVTSKSWPTRKPDAAIKFERVQVKTYSYNQDELEKSKQEFIKQGGKYENDDVFDPKCWTYIFAHSGVPSGGFIITGGIVKSEKEWIKRKTWYVQLREGDPKLPKFFDIPHAADWGNKRQYKEIWDRLKLYFGFWYTYNKDGKQKYMELNRNGLPPSRCAIWKFMKLRHKALWSGMFNPNMLQINCYHKNKGIAQHFDELVWFPAPVHSLRIGGWAKLHFGMKGQGGNPPKGSRLEKLCIEINDGEFFKMSGIIQILYKHGIPKGQKWLTEDTVSILIRKSNSYACGVPLEKSLI